MSRQAFRLLALGGMGKGGAIRRRILCTRYIWGFKRCVLSVVQCRVGVRPLWSYSGVWYQTFAVRQSSKAEAEDSYCDKAILRVCTVVLICISTCSDT